MYDKQHRQTSQQTSIYASGQLLQEGIATTDADESMPLFEFIRGGYRYG